jgi:acyl-CoA synthetase (AMP-forming)/AMP-acid ligase II
MTFTLAGLIREQAAGRADDTALIYNDLTYSYRELDERSSQLANALAARGISAGDRVALLARNCPVFYEAVFACSKLGAVLVALNWRLSARELETIVTDSDSKIHLVDDEFAANLVSGPTVTVTVQHDYESLLAEQPAIDPGLESGAPPIGGETPVLQLYSSGTTGQPKGIVITNDNLSKTPVTAEDLFLMSSDTVNLVISPLFHIGGIGYGMHAFTRGGATVIATAADAETLCGLIERWGVTHSFMVPSMIQSLVDSPRLATADSSSLQTIAFGGSPISETLFRRASAALGCGFTAVYGMTETSGTVVGDVPDPSASDDDRLRTLGSCGRPLPWMGEIGIFDPVTAEPAQPGVTGEIWVRSQQVMSGYWKRPDATAEAIRPDGWFRTGDAAYRDENGYFFLQDRLKDMIISGGENVFPAEVESVVYELPAIRDVAVIGVPSEKWGETVKAVATLRPGHETTAAEVIAYTRANLAHYKCPTSVDFVDELPHNSAGKILKPEVRSWYRANAEVAK